MTRKLEEWRFITRPEPIEYTVAKPAGIHLIGDPHIGGRHTDKAKLRRECQTAIDRGDRLNVNGDVFDAILPRDLKRFTLTASEKVLNHNNAVINEAVEMVVDFFRPFARNMDMMGSGNHETAVERHHHFDLTREVVRRLNAETGSRIHNGGYMGYIDYRFRARGATSAIGKRARFVIFYFHGAGGGAEVTKGMIRLQRLNCWVSDANVVWLAHYHTRIHDGTASMMRCPYGGPEPAFFDRDSIITGSYIDTMKRPRHYAVEKGLAPQRKGGARITIKFDRNGGIEPDGVKVTM